MNKGVLSILLQDKLKQAAKQAGAVFYIDARKANLKNPGNNAPLTNPWKDLSGNGNDATLVNCAGTAADGYLMKLLPNGRTMPMFKPEGTDTYGTMVNTASMDITGTEDFAICGAFLTSAALQTGYIISSASEALGNTRYGVYEDFGGSIGMALNGSAIALSSAGSVVANAMYEYRVFRIGGRLKCKLNLVETYNQANVASLTTQPNTRLFARSSNAGGTTHNLFNKSFQAYLAVFRGSRCTEANVNKFCELAKKGYV